MKKIRFLKFTEFKTARRWTTPTHPAPSVGLAQRVAGKFEGNAVGRRETTVSEWVRGHAPPGGPLGTLGREKADPNPQHNLVLPQPDDETILFPQTLRVGHEWGGRDQHWRALPWPHTDLHWPHLFGSSDGLKMGSTLAALKGCFCSEDGLVWTLLSLHSHQLRTQGREGLSWDSVNGVDTESSARDLNAVNGRAKSYKLRVPLGLILSQEQVHVQTATRQVPFSRLNCPASQHKWQPCKQWGPGVPFIPPVVDGDWENTFKSTTRKTPSGCGWNLAWRHP